MTDRRTKRLLGLLALAILMTFPLQADAAADGVRFAQASSPAAPEQSAPAEPQQQQSATPAQTGQQQPPPEPEKPARPACLDQFGAVMPEAGILFNWGSSDLRRQEVEAIDRIAEYAKSCPQAHFQIDGHTDSSGPRRYNQAFSEQRAGTVIRELEARGVDPSRLSPATGHGEGKPKESNWSREGRQANRRVEIIMTR